MHSFLRVIQATQFLKKYFAFQLFKRFDEYSNKNNWKNIHLQIIVFSLFEIGIHKEGVKYFGEVFDVFVA